MITRKIVFQAALVHLSSLFDFTDQALKAMHARERVLRLILYADFSKTKAKFLRNI